MTALDPFALNPEVMDAATLTARLSSAALLGLLIGVDPSRRALGFSTLGAAVVAVLAALAALFARMVFLGQIPMSPLMLIESAVVLTAWLAIGTIFYTRRSLRTLSLATTLWVSAGLGLAAGAGLYVIGFLIAPLGIVLLALVRWLAAVESPVPAEQPVRAPAPIGGGLIPLPRPVTPMTSSSERTVLRTWWNR